MHRRRKWFLIGPALLAAFAVIILIGGYVVMSLWNWLLPPLFGWREVTVWQALGLLALARILFGGFGRGGRCGPRHRGPRGRHWTPDERERFKHDSSIGPSGDRAIGSF